MFEPLIVTEEEYPVNEIFFKDNGVPRKPVSKGFSLLFLWVLHRELWMWMSENPGLSKQSWPGFYLYPRIVNSCFACQFSVNRNKEGKPISDCLSHCFLDWGTENPKYSEVPCETYPESPYVYWMEEGLEGRAEEARLVANLPINRKHLQEFIGGTYYED